MIEHYLIGLPEGGWATACRPNETVFSSAQQILDTMPGPGTPRCSQCEGTIERLLSVYVCQDDLDYADGPEVIATINGLDQ